MFGIEDDSPSVATRKTKTDNARKSSADESRTKSLNPQTTLSTISSSSSRRRNEDHGLGTKSDSFLEVSARPAPRVIRQPSGDSAAATSRRQSFAPVTSRQQSFTLPVFQPERIKPAVSRTIPDRSIFTFATPIARPAQPEQRPTSRTANTTHERIFKLNPSLAATFAPALTSTPSARNPATSSSSVTNLAPQAASTPRPTSLMFTPRRQDPSTVPMDIDQRHMGPPNNVPSTESRMRRDASMQETANASTRKPWAGGAQLSTRTMPTFPQRRDLGQHSLVQQSVRPSGAEERSAIKQSKLTFFLRRHTRG